MSHAIIASIYEAKLIAWNAGRAEKLKIVFENTAYTPGEGRHIFELSLSRATPRATRSAVITGCIPECFKSASSRRRVPGRPRPIQLPPNSSRYSRCMCAT